MLKIYKPNTAIETILKRQVLDDLSVSPSIESRIRELFGERLTPNQAVERIIMDIRKRGDEALQYWTEKLDGKKASQIRCTKTELIDALNGLDKQQKIAIELAIKRVKVFHETQPITSWFTQSLGGMLGQIVRPIERIGLYIPAGSAPLPSSIIMSAVIAQVAGVPEIVIVAPPKYGTGKVDNLILATAALLGIDEVYCVGGAQAIGALAFGTETIGKVDKIFGPGNLFVTLAKRQVYGVVGIDSLAGPTETMVVADEYANPAWVASDLLAQAEHDTLAAAILLSPSETLIHRVNEEIKAQLSERGRSDFILASLGNRSGAIHTQNLQEAIDLANAYAPEHLCLAVTDPWQWVQKVKAAGGVFLGEHSFEVLGDYVAGPSHVMPTSGSARFASPLNILDFIHIISLIALDPLTTGEIAQSAAIIAQAEGLDGHAYAAKVRL